MDLGLDGHIVMWQKGEQCEKAWNGNFFVGNTRVAWELDEINFDMSQLSAGSNQHEKYSFTIKMKLWS